MNEPLIWTTRGNVPVSMLNCEREWDVQDTYVKFVERYRDASGEVVREDAHVYSKVGLAVEGVAAEIG